MAQAAGDPLRHRSQAAGHGSFLALSQTRAISTKRGRFLMASGMAATLDGASRVDLNLNAEDSISLLWLAAIEMTSSRSLARTGQVESH